MDYLEEARKFAKEMKSDYLGTEHVMYTMLANDPIASKYLFIEAEDFKQELIDTVGIPDTRKRSYGKIMTPKLKSILTRLTNSGKDLTPETFIPAIFYDGMGVAVRLLDKLDADFDSYIEKIHENDIPEILLKNDFIVNLNDKVSNKDPHVYNMKDKSDEIINNLFRVRKPNILLVGKAGCGKSALVEYLAKRINDNNVPEFMKDKAIFEFIVPNTVAGTKYRGEFEERVKNVLNSVQKCSRVILFIDEFHTVMTAGAAEGAVSFANILKPYLARGEISLIGATTDEEYEYIKKDKAMQRRFTVIHMDPPDEEATMEILKGWKNKLESHYHTSINDEVLRNIIKQCRKDKQHSSPDKELDALEKWCLEHCNWRAVDWELVKNS